MEEENPTRLITRQHMLRICWRKNWGYSSSSVEEVGWPTLILCRISMKKCSVSHHRICSTLFTACFPQCSTLATIFKCGLIADTALQNVFFV